MPRKSSTKYIHVNQHKIRANLKHGTNEPVITIKEGRKNTYCHEVEILGPSKVIYGDHDADEIYFEGVDQALQIPGIDIRLFGKPKSFKKRRMGVILASSDTVKAAINNAKKASSKIKIKIKA